MTNCIIKLELNGIEAKISNIIKDNVGTNQTLYNRYIFRILDDNNTALNTDFKQYLKDNYNINIDSDISKISSKDLFNAIRNYENSKGLDVDYSFSPDGSDYLYYFRYNSIEDRKFCINMAAQLIQDFKYQDENKYFRKIEGNKQQYYSDAVIRKIEDILLERLASKTGKSFDDLLDLMDEKEDYLVDFEKMLQDNSTIQDRNLFAMYKEMLINGEEFFKEVFRDSNLSSLRIFEDETNKEYKAETEQEEKDYDTADEGIDDSSSPVEGSESNISDDKDHSIAGLNDKAGAEYSSFMAHVTADIRDYLSSLPKLKSNRTKIDEKGNKQFIDFDLDNPLGIKNRMNSKDIILSLFSQGPYMNLEHLVDTLKYLASNVDGFTGLYKVIEDINNNSDIAFKLMQTFSKEVIHKLRTDVSEDNVSIRLSNRNTDKLTALRFEFINSLKITSNFLDHDDNLREFNDLQNLIGIIKADIDDLKSLRGKIRIDTEKSIDVNKAKLINKLSTLIKYYYPTIDKPTIAYFIKDSSNGDFIANVNILLNHLNKTINAAKLQETSISNRNTQIYELRKERKEIYKQYERSEDITKEDQQLVDLIENKIRSLYETNIQVNNLVAAATNLANTLVKHSTVKIDLNHINVEGKQITSVINTNFITNVMRTLQTNLGRRNYGKAKSQSRQYDNSNIIVEHRDENGEIINYGLFTIDENNDFIPTPYAEKLLKHSLFDGASNNDTFETLLYKHMSKEDYTATAFINFFRNDEHYEADKTDEISDVAFANYFMRIPSDAPKNFIITAPKYTAKRTKKEKGLFGIEEGQKAVDLIRSEYNKFVTIDRSEFDNIKQSISLVQPTKPGSVDTVDELVNRVLNNEGTSIRVFRNNITENTRTNSVKDGDKVTSYFLFKADDGSEVIYRMSGIFRNTTSKLVEIENAKFDGFVKGTVSPTIENAVKLKIRSNLLKENKLNRSVNREHRIFKQFRNIFLQELTDAANALNVIFENTDGLIRLEDGNPVFRTGFGNDAATVRRLFKNYHTDGKNVIVKGKDGRWHLTGKVFTSTKFKINVIDENGKLTVLDFGKKILEEAFNNNFLYGGSTNQYLPTTVTNKGVKLDLEKRPDLLEIIDRNIAEYLKEFVKNEIKEYNKDYKDVIPKTLFNEANIIDFALNTTLMQISYDDLFEGDVKFYKSNKDFFKRAKESQGSGLLYGCVNYQIDTTASAQHIKSLLDTMVFKHITENGTEDYKVDLKDRFRGVTIKNTIRNSKELAIEGVNDAKKDGVLVTKLTKILNDRERAVSIIEGFKNTTVNDAQSYITFDEWIRRITLRGQLKKHEALINRLLDETTDLDPNDLAEFVQVQKNFYYDIHYNSELNVAHPRQIKNAEFVLIPKLIKNTQLELVYDLMKKHNIDQLNTEETSKAGKANVLTIWDNNGEIMQDNIDDFEKAISKKNNNGSVNEAIEEYFYNNLYTQQETPQHMNAQNKAGIQIMKKICDNISRNSPLWENKQEFFRLYSANIFGSYEELTDELGLELDENKNIVLKDGTQISKIDAGVFFNKLYDECCRLGLDSNAIDYITISDEAKKTSSIAFASAMTNMPTFMGNFSTKLESIAQSVFNNRITRQKLPGFHAAQITSVGFDAKNEKVIYEANEDGKKAGVEDRISAEEYSKLTKDKKKLYNKRKGSIIASTKLKYHPEGKSHDEAKPYIEVMVPKSAFKFNRYKIDENGNKVLKTDIELLTELQNAHLDEIIGYRIPTEGKQSIAVMKIVGFLDDAQGSTIVVPDAWVSQTGSDFDIDSIYAIQFNTYIDKNGNIRKTKYQQKHSPKHYINYINRRLEHRHPTVTNKKLDELRENVTKQLGIEFDEYRHDESKAYHNLPKTIKEIIIKEQAETPDNDSRKEHYIDQTNRVIAALNEYKEKTKLSEEDSKKLETFLEAERKINDRLKDNEYAERFGEEVNKEVLKVVENISKEAKEQGLPTYEQYLELSIEEINDKRSRDNKLLDCMKTILQHDSSLEENLSRSNFEGITNARYEVEPENIKNIRDNRSPYNFRDQAANMDDAMSGAKLKAFSVTRDTFCSICNTVQPNINPAFQFKTIYRKSDGYDPEKLIETFGEDNVKEIKDGIYKVTHTMYGWSLNNRAVTGDLLTVWSSETTAHILDAIKEGFIQNVNDYTFGVYKIFPEVGADYKTAISFMMLPGISSIVKYYNSNKSIYNTNNVNPIKEAFKENVIKLMRLYGDKVPQFLSYRDAYAYFVNHIEDLKGLEGLDLNDYFDKANHNVAFLSNSDDIINVPFNSKLFNDRNNNNGVFTDEVGKTLFDLLTILQFNKLYDFSNSVTAYARVSNPDKFGAKQSIYATNKIFDSIKNIVKRDKVSNTTPLNVDGKSIIEAIYPSITDSTLEEFITSPVQQSAYQPLYYFLKFVTAPSIKINRTLFETQSPNFISLVESLGTLLTGNSLDEKTYKQFETYILNKFYYQTTALRGTPIFFYGEGDNTGKVIYDTSISEDYEKARVFGYNCNVSFLVPNITYDKIHKLYTKGETSVTFEVKDLSNPTQEELIQFSMLSPAQKVVFVQNHSSNAGVFNYIQVDLMDARKGKEGQHTMRFKEDAADIERVYDDFFKCFYNNNPLIKLAAIDLIKYAFIAEGFSMKRGAINKMIPNHVLMTSQEDGGTGIVDEIRDQLSNIRNVDGNGDIRDVAENYIRSNASLKGIPKLYVKESKREVIKVSKDINGNIIKRIVKEKSAELHPDKKGIITLDLRNKTQLKLAETYKIIDSNTTSEADVKLNSYVRLKFKGRTKPVLYKITKINSLFADGVFMYPLNDLAENENSEWSANEDNNIWPNRNYYEEVKDRYEERSLGIASIENKEAIAESQQTGQDVITDFDPLTDARQAIDVKKYQYTRRNNNQHGVKSFDINNENDTHFGAFNEAKKAILERFEDNTATELVIMNKGISSYFSNATPSDYSIQTINGRKYKFQKINTKHLNSRYLYYGKDFAKNANGVTVENPDIVKIYTEAKKTYTKGSAGVQYLIRITPYKESIESTPIETIEKVDDNTTKMQSTITDSIIVPFIDDINTQFTNSNSMEVKDTKEYFRKNEINRTEESQKGYEIDLVLRASRHVETNTNKLIYDTTHFIRKDDSKDDDTWYSISDPEVIDLIRKDPVERNRYLKTILKARAFAKRYELIKELDIDSEDPEIQRALNNIKQAVTKLQNASNIVKAEEQFVHDFLKKLSDNPNIQADYATLLDGYHSASMFDAWINDMQETTSPLLQIITKEVMGDIRKQELIGQKDARKFREDLQAIMKKAKANGRPVNMSNIIDDYGRLKRPYNEAFEIAIEELRAAIADAEKTYGKYSRQAFKAKLDYDKFKLNNTHQNVVDDYYRERIKLQEDIIAHQFPIYAEYRRLLDERNQIFNYASEGHLDNAYKEKLKKINNDIDNLTKAHIFNLDTGFIEVKYSADDPNNPLKGDTRFIYSIEATSALNKFINANTKLNSKYFKKTAIEGFQDELDRYEDYIIKVEARDENGIPTTSMVTLMNDPEYIKAKEWINNNAKYVLNDETIDFINQQFLVLKEGKEGKSSRTAINTYAKKQDAYDAMGVIDGTKFTKEQVEIIKKQQLSRLGLKEGNPFSDRKIISNAPKLNVIFKNAFYLGMTSNGANNSEYDKIINGYDIKNSDGTETHVFGINEILKKYYNSSEQILELYKITSEDAAYLKKAFALLDATKRKVGATNNKAVSKFIEENVEFTYNWEQFELDKKNAEINGNLSAFNNIATETIENKDGTVTVVPNRKLYGFAIPKGYKLDGTGNNDFVDKPRTKAIQILKEYIKTTPTKYYYAKAREMMNISKEAYNTWYKENHIYNPNTHRYEPLDIWMHTEYNPICGEGTWIPKAINTRSEVKNGKDANGKPDGSEDYSNHNFKKDGSTASNFKATSNNKEYQQDITLTKEEKDVKDLIEAVMAKYVKSPTAQKYYDKGFLPSKAKNAKVDTKFILKEVAKLAGWIEQGIDAPTQIGEVDYGNDRTIDMPFMTMLKSKESTDINYHRPERTEGMTDEEYNNVLETWRKEKREAEKKNLEEHKKLLNDNWEDVISDFIIKASHFNAVQDNKYMLFFAKNMLDRIKVFETEVGTNNYKRTNKSTKEHKDYLTKQDTNTIKQYQNWLKRLVYDQWKSSNNKFVRGANVAQSFTSAKYMMLNLTGGLSNITVGKTNIWMEEWAGEYFGTKNWHAGLATWTKGIPSYFADLNKDNASTLANAIIKDLNIVDFDEIAGLISGEGLTKYSNRVRSALYSQQAIGEHFMQNTAMFALMHSHRLFENKDNNGRTKYVYKNLEEHLRDADKKALLLILDDRKLGLFKKFIKYEMSDENQKRKYMWFRKNDVVQFVNLYLTNAEKEQFKAKRNELRKEAEMEFNNDETHPTIFSQLALTEDGHMGFKEGSIFEQIGDDEAYAIIGRFKGRIISVNKKIHGIYDKLGAAMLESHWLGGLIMQYHKHIYPGIMKRYRRQGYFNEERGTIEKGIYASIKDFLTLPLDKVKFQDKLKRDGISEGELKVLEGTQNIFKEYVNFFANLSLNYKVLPEYEKANIRRFLGDIAGILSGMLMAVAVSGWDDDSRLKYYFILQADRLSSESFMWNPIGLTSEAKKQWSSPVAIQGFVSDCINTMGLLCQAMFQGDDFDPVYESGIYAGENKGTVWLKRNLPVYHSYNTLYNLKRNHDYFKRGFSLTNWINDED